VVALRLWMAFSFLMGTILHRERLEEKTRLTFLALKTWARMVSIFSKRRLLTMCERPRQPIRMDEEFGSQPKVVHIRKCCYGH
jgi:hypothetical protein